jgi:hypothetical protein
MSFDVFFQRFKDGEADPSGGDVMRRVLAPFVVREEPEHHFVLIEFGDGTADLYLHDDHMMTNHVTGQLPWDLLVDGAREAGWAILPVGCPTCITDEAQRQHLPEGLNEEVATVLTGADFLRVIHSA